MQRKKERNYLLYNSVFSTDSLIYLQKTYFGSVLKNNSTFRTEDYKSIDVWEPIKPYYIWIFEKNDLKIIVENMITIIA